MKNQSSSPSIIRWIFAAVLVWGSVLAIGAYVNGGENGLRNGLLVIFCVGGFLAFWMSMLSLRRNHRS